MNQSLTARVFPRPSPSVCCLMRYPSFELQRIIAQLFECDDIFCPRLIFLFQLSAEKIVSTFWLIWARQQNCVDSFVLQAAVAATTLLYFFCLQHCLTFLFFIHVRADTAAALLVKEKKKKGKWSGWEKDQIGQQVDSIVFIVLLVFSVGPTYFPNGEKVKTNKRQPLFLLRYIQSTTGKRKKG